MAKEQKAGQYLPPFNTILNIDIITGTGTPTISAKKGSLYIKTDASGTTDRLWVNTDGSTTWTYFTSNA